MQTALFLYSILGGTIMTDTEKQLLQAKNRWEEAQARDRADEQGKWQYKTEKEYLCVRVWIVPPFPESKPLMIRSIVLSPWQKPKGMCPICWMNTRKNPALSGSGFASSSKNKLYSARKKKTWIGKHIGQHQINGAARCFSAFCSRYHQSVPGFCK